MQERRRKPRRRISQAELVLSSADETGRLCKIKGSALDQSDAGLGIEVDVHLEPGTTLTIEAPPESGTQSGEAVVRWCRRSSSGRYQVGIVYAAPSSRLWNTGDSGPKFDEDLYEVLQVSPNADQETITRVFRFLAARHHPDHAETGNAEFFQKIVQAHRVLSDPEQRAAFDVWHTGKRRRQWKLFESASVSTGAAAEKRKRAGLIAALYTKRMSEPDQPMMGLRDMETLLGCPKEHLEFALWYLKEGGFVVRTDNGRFQITAKGVDLAESGSDEHPAPKAPLLIAAGS